MVDFVISHMVEGVIRYKLNYPLCPDTKSFDVLLPACSQHARDQICRHLTAQVRRHSTAELQNESLETVNRDIDLESLRCGRCPGKLFETQKNLKIHWRDNHSAKIVDLTLEILDTAHMLTSRTTVTHPAVSKPHGKSTRHSKHTFSHWSSKVSILRSLHHLVHSHTGRLISLRVLTPWYPDIFYFAQSPYCIV